MALELPRVPPTLFHAESFRLRPSSRVASPDGRIVLPLARDADGYFLTRERSGPRLDASDSSGLVPAAAVRVGPIEREHGNHRVAHVLRAHVALNVLDTLLHVPEAVADPSRKAPGQWRSTCIAHAGGTFGELREEIDGVGLVLVRELIELRLELFSTQVLDGDAMQLGLDEASFVWKEDEVSAALHVRSTARAAHTVNLDVAAGRDADLDDTCDSGVVDASSGNVGRQHDHCA